MQPSTRASVTTCSLFCHHHYYALLSSHSSSLLVSALWQGNRVQCSGDRWSARWVVLICTDSRRARRNRRRGGRGASALTAAWSSTQSRSVHSRVCLLLSNRQCGESQPAVSLGSVCCLPSPGAVVEAPALHSPSTDRWSFTWTFTLTSHRTHLYPFSIVKAGQAISHTHFINSSFCHLYSFQSHQPTAASNDRQFATCNWSALSKQLQQHQANLNKI